MTNRGMEGGVLKKKGFNHLGRSIAYSYSCVNRVHDWLWGGLSTAKIRKKSQRFLDLERGN